MSRSPELTEILDRVQSAAASRVYVATPAKVERFDAAKRQIDAQPLIKDGYVDEDGVRQTEIRPVIPNVPVVYPTGGGFTVTWPLSIGDGVLLVFSRDSLDKWLAVGGMVDPNDDTKHNFVDAIAIPGLLDFQTAAGKAAVGTCIQIGSASGATFQGAALGADLKTYLDNLELALAGLQAQALTWTVTRPSVPVLESATVKVTP